MRRASYPRTRRPLDPGRIEVIGADMTIGDAARRRIAARIEHDNLVPQTLRRHAKHPAQLAAAEQTEPFTRRN